MTNWKGLKRVFRYIRDTLEYGLFFIQGSNSEILLQTYVDANWATNKDQKSTSGFLVQVFGCTVIWSTKKQTGIIFSSTEAEYVAIAATLTDVIWLKGLLEDFGVRTVNLIVVYEDNQSVTYLEHRRTKPQNLKPVITSTVTRSARTRNNCLMLIYRRKLTQTCISNYIYIYIYI